MIGCIIWMMIVFTGIVGGCFLLEKIDNKVNFAEKIINMK